MQRERTRRNGCSAARAGDDVAEDRSGGRCRALGRGGTAVATGFAFAASRAIISGARLICARYKADTHSCGVRFKGLDKQGLVTSDLADALWLNHVTNAVRRAAGIG